MPVEFTMPKLGLTMEEGTIVEWLVASDSPVKAGEAVLVVDTDKVQTEVEIPDGGRLVPTGEVGSTYKCGEVIGWLLAAGERVPNPTSPVASAPVATSAAAVVSRAEVVSGLQTTSETRSSGGRVLASPYARVRSKELGVDLAAVVGTGPGGRIVASDVEAASVNRTSAPVPSAASGFAAAGSGTRRGVQPPATYAASELARLVGLDLSAHAIRATSADGRISRDDVAAYIRSLLNSPSPTATRPASAPAATQQPTEVIALKGMRGTIATRMRASLQDTAQLTLMMDVDMDAVVADRNSRKGSDSVPGYTDYVIAASARALRDHPRVNSQITPDGIALLPEVHVGMAVALDEGLVVPVVHNADQLDLATLSAQTTALASAARSQTLKLADMEGGTFSVSALGMFGVDGFTPVINPPNAAILGVGRLRDDVAWAADGSIRRVKRLTLSLTWDHRILDGAPAAEFVQSICRYLDDPSTLS